MDMRISTWFRFLMWIAAAVALLDAVSLALFPDKTADYFAWSIQNPLTPIFMAGGYLSVTIFLAVTPALTGFRWSKNRMTIAAGVVFTTMMGIATFLHLSTFFWDRFGAWLWALLYILYPLLFALGFWWHERAYKREESHGAVPVHPIARIIIIADACLLGILGLSLFFLPDTVGSIWPWALTPLTAQVVAGWLLALACFAAFLGQVRRWGTMRWVAIGGLGWPILLLLDSPRFVGSFKSVAHALAFYAIVLLWVIGIIVLVVYHEYHERQVAGTPVEATTVLKDSGPNGIPIIAGSPGPSVADRAGER